jgi:hypothetical protein
MHIRQAKKILQHSLTTHKTNTFLGAYWRCVDVATKKSGHEWIRWQELLHRASDWVGA